MPLSLVITRTAARRGFARSVSSGWDRFFDALASSPSTLVISSAYGFAAATLACALEIREVAISSWALVIFLIEFTPRMRERNSRKLATVRPPFIRPGRLDADNRMAHHS